MSKISDLKQQMGHVSKESRTASGSLSQFQGRLAGHIRQVQNLIGGTATKEDANIIAVLEEARRATEKAAQALQQAAQRCDNYSQQL